MVPFWDFFFHLIDVLLMLRLFYILQRFYRFLELKSKDRDAAVPPLDETLRKITEPDPDIFSQNKSIIDDFRRCFEIKENPKVNNHSCLVQ